MKIAPFLLAGEPLLAGVSSTPAAASGGAGIGEDWRGLPAENGSGYLAPRDRGPSPNVLSGLVGLTDSRLVAIGGDGVYVEVDRNKITRLEISESMVGPRMCKVEVVTASGSYELHGRAKQTQAIVDLLREQVDIFDNRPDRRTSVNSMPFIVGYLMSVVVGVNALAVYPTEAWPVAVSAFMLFVTEGLRRFFSLQEAGSARP